MAMTVISAARDRVGGDAAQTTAQESALELLSGIAVALGHDVDAEFLLAELASGVRRTLDADRVSVLLLDDEGRLTPALAVARQHNDDLWQRFRSMPPIALDALPGARQALGRGQVLLIDDASTSPLIPRAWQRTFELASLAVAPLLVDDAPGGLLAVEYSLTAAPFTPTQRSLLEGMAGLAGIALGAGRRRSQAERFENVSAAVRALGGVHTFRAVAEHALSAMLDAAGVGHGLFARIDNDTVEVVAARGSDLPEPGRYALTLLPAELVTTCRDTWSSDPRALVSAVVSGTSYSVLPVTSGGLPGALVVLPVVTSSLPYDVTAELQLIADAAATALQAVHAADDLDWHRRALAAVPSFTPAATV